MDYTSPTYNIQLLPSYTLWIKVDFASEHIVVSNEKMEILRYISHEKGKPTSEGLKLLSLPFEKIKLLVPESNFMIHPLDLFKKDEWSVYKGFMSFGSSEELHLYKAEELNLAVVYSYDPWLIADWNKIFPNLEKVAECSLFLETMKEYKGKDYRVFIHEMDNKTIFCVANDEKILLFNSFEVKKEEDFQFYLLKILEQLNVQTYFDTCIISQEKKNIELAKVASQYAKQVKVVENHFKIEGEDVHFSELRGLNFRN